MITIVGCNKGGASKTTTATSLAVALAMGGKDVCLVDADAQRSAAKWFADREQAGAKYGFTLIEKRENIASTLKSLATKFDHVIVDVAGRNSRELITGGTVADIIIAPHQCSQFDLDTLEELRVQQQSWTDLNPDLKIYIYQAMASTNKNVKEEERRQFLQYLSDFSEFTVLNSVGYSRKIYKDVASLGLSVLEMRKNPAADEIAALVKEVYS